jgi:secreted trypsin-like serine protease
MIGCKKTMMICALSVTVFSFVTSWAMDKKVELEHDIVGECITQVEAKVYTNFAQLIAAQDKKNTNPKKESQDKQRMFGRGSSGKNEQKVIQLQCAKL